MERWKSYSDIEVGARFKGPGRTITEADVVMFTALTCGFHQPIHTDLEWVRENTAFEERLLPGPAILAYAIGLLSSTLVYRDITVAFAGIDALRARAPVFPGDTITATAEVKSKRVTSDGTKAVVTLAITVTKQNGAAVMTCDYALMVRADATAATNESEKEKQDAR